MKNCLLLLLLFPLSINAQITLYGRFPTEPVNYVTDQAGVLSQSEEDQLNAKLKNFEDSTSNQLFIYIAESLRANDLEDFSREIFNKWGIGQKDKNNGILIAIFIKDRKYRIQVGYGLEAALPSELTLQIQDEDMGPRFKEKDYYEGIDAGVDQLIYYSKNEFKPRSWLYPYYPLLIGAYSISALFFIINLLSLRKWKNQPKRRKKNLLACAVFLLVPGLGTIVLIGLCTVINDKKESEYDNETDIAYERRMRKDRSSSSNSSSDDNFSGGGGGSSGSGGSSSSW
jgi:uncharacterized membrane protein YgcG